MVQTSTPVRRIFSKMGGERPEPPAAFSALATTKSMARSWMSLGRSSATTRRPGLPTMSPRQRILRGMGTTF